MSSVIQTTSRRAQLLAFSLALFPPCFLAVLVFTYSVDFPQWDQWGYVPFFEEFSRGSLTFSHLFAQVNEYRQFFPNLVFVTLGWLTRWDVRYEMWALFLLACLISFNIYRLARLTTGGVGLRGFLLFFMANVLIFSPSQSENWLQGQQLVYYVPIACITGCILVAHSRLPPIARFSVCACLSTISTFSSANGGLCWVVILPVLLTASRSPIPNRTWFVIAWVLGFLSNAALYLRGYHKPWWSPSPLMALANPLQAVLYFLRFLGAPLGLESGNLSAILGIVLLSLFAFGSALVIRYRHDSTLVRRMIPWLMIGAYSILTAGMTMIGRVGMGARQSMNVRYIGYSVYLVVSLIFLVPLIADKLVSETKFPRRHRLAQVTTAVAILFLLWQPLVFAKGIQRMKGMRLKVLQAKAGVLLIDIAPDRELVNTLYPDLSFLAAKANVLDELGFLRPRLVKSKRVQDFEGAKVGADGYGSLDHGETFGKMYLVSGIATLPYRREAADAVILAYEKPNGDCVVFALTHPKIGPGDPPFAGDGGRNFQRWEQSFSGDQLPFRPAKITAWAFDANSAKAFRLDGSYVIQ
jgi:hypothetical protein